MTGLSRSPFTNAFALLFAVDASLALAVGSVARLRCSGRCVRRGIGPRATGGVVVSQRAGVDRRQWLHWAVAGGAGLCLPAAFSRTPLLVQPFSLGVASGAPTHQSAVLWTRVLFELGRPPPSPALEVRWELAHDEHFGRMVQSGLAPAPAALAHSVHVELQGLAPDRWYFYRFLLGDATSRTGRVRTLPAPETPAQRLRLAYASCQRWEHGYYSAWRHMCDENLDLVMFLGDYIYEYPGAGQPVRRGAGSWASTLDGYRDRYALYKSDADLQAIHAACPWLITWDDHEVQNDYSGVSPGDSGPPAADFAARRTAAYQAFYEHMPLRASALTQALSGLASGAEMRIYAQVSYGRLASLYTLDARQYRDAQVCTRNGKSGASTVDPATCPAWNDPARSLLGQQQEAWLEARLGASAGRGGPWNVLGQQTLFGQRDFRAKAGQTLWNDGWDGYTAARGRLTGALQKSAAGTPVFLGGDVHENWVGHVKADYANPASAAIGVEFCGTSISSRSAGNAKLGEVLAENPHFVFADSERRGYGVADFSPNRLLTTLRVVSDVTRPDSGIETLASFSVEAGSVVVDRA